MNSQPIEVIDAKGLYSFKYPRIVHNGYLYHFGKKCTNHLRWKCCRVLSLKCPAVLRTTTDMSEITHIAVDHEHVHANDLVEIEALKNKINEHKQSSLSRRNTCFISKDLDEVFEEIHIPENPDYKNGNTEKYIKLMENTNSKDTIFNFENNPFNKLEQKNNKNQVSNLNIEINLEDGIKKNYTSYFQNLPINTTTTTSTPVLKSISTIGSLPSIKVTYNMIESRLNKNIDNENENESISDGNDNDDDDDDDDDSIFGSDEANYNAVIDDDNDDEENNIQLVQEDCMLHLNYIKKNWSTILKKMSDPLTGIKTFESILLKKVLIQMMQGKNRTYRKILIFKGRSIDYWKKKYDRLQHKLTTLVSIIRSDRNMRRISVLNKKAKQFDYDTEYRNVDALSRVQVNDEAKIDGEDKEPTRPTRTRRPSTRLSEFYSY